MLKRKFSSIRFGRFFLADVKKQTMAPCCAVAHQQYEHPVIFPEHKSWPEFHLKSCETSLAHQPSQPYGLHYGAQPQLLNHRTPNAAETTARGLFFLFEGGDRCGKTTQSQMLLDALRTSGKLVRYYKFPDSKGESGRVIRDYLDGKRDDKDVNIQKLFCEQRKMLLSEMQALLLQGTYLVVDRYSFSGLAYSNAQSENFDECKTQENDLLSPDVVFFVDCDPIVAANRNSYGDDRYEKLDIQRRVRETFLGLLNYYERHAEREGWWQRLDASKKSAEDLHAEVMTKVDKLLQCPLPISHLNFNDVCLYDADDDTSSSIANDVS